MTGLASHPLLRLDAVPNALQTIFGIGDGPAGAGAAGAWGRVLGAVQVWLLSLNGDTLQAVVVLLAWLLAVLVVVEFLVVRAGWRKRGGPTHVAVFSDLQPSLLARFDTFAFIIREVGDAGWEITWGPTRAEAARLQATGTLCAVGADINGALHVFARPQFLYDEYVGPSAAAAAPGKKKRTKGDPATATVETTAAAAAMPRGVFFHGARDAASVAALAESLRAEKNGAVVADRWAAVAHDGDSDMHVWYPMH